MLLNGKLSARDMEHLDDSIQRQFGVDTLSALQDYSGVAPPQGGREGCADDKQAAWSVG